MGTSKGALSSNLLKSDIESQNTLLMENQMEAEYKRRSQLRSSMVIPSASSTPQIMFAGI